MRLNIVGFAIKNPKTQKDLAGFAKATGGLFYAAQSGALGQQVTLTLAMKNGQIVLQ